jgi:hypothetical protein
MPKRIKVTGDNDTGRHLGFYDNRTGADMTRSQFVRQIEAGTYNGFHVQELDGVKTPLSNPDRSKNNNLG